MAQGPYSRLYHVIADEFPDIYEVDRIFGCYVKLLMAADAAWPLRPHVPAGANRRAVTTLVEVGLVLVDRGRYTVRGLEAERSRRKAAAQVGGRARAQRLLTGALSNGAAAAEPSRAEQSRAEGKRGAKALEGRDVDARVDP